MSTYASTRTIPVSVITRTCVCLCGSTYTKQNINIYTLVYQHSRRFSRRAQGLLVELSCPLLSHRETPVRVYVDQHTLNNISTYIHQYIRSLDDTVDWRKSLFLNYLAHCSLAKRHLCVPMWISVHWTRYQHLICIYQHSRRYSWLARDPLVELSCPLLSCRERGRESEWVSERDTDRDSERERRESEWDITRSYPVN